MIVSITCRHGAVKDLRKFVVGVLSGIELQMGDASRIELIFEPEHQYDQVSEYTCHLSIFRGHKAPMHFEGLGPDAFTAFDSAIDCLLNRLHKEQCSKRRLRRLVSEDWGAGA